MNHTPADLFGWLWKIGLAILGGILTYILLPLDRRVRKLEETKVDKTHCKYADGSSKTRLDELKKDNAEQHSQIFGKLDWIINYLVNGGKR